jgi:hypothetical protein
VSERRLKNVTITLTADEARKARILAAERNMSVSRFFATLLGAQLSDRERKAEAWRQIRSVEPVDLSGGEPLPGREELYDRPYPGKFA